MGIPAYAGNLKEARRGVGRSGIGHAPDKGGQAPVAFHWAAEDVQGFPRYGVSDRDAQNLDGGAADRGERGNGSSLTSGGCRNLDGGG